MLQTRKEHMQELPSSSIVTRPDTLPDLSEISGLPAVPSSAQRLLPNWSSWPKFAGRVSTQDVRDTTAMVQAASVRIVPHV